MDNTTAGFLAAGIGFIGAIIGGYFSYLGSKSAAKESIRAQNEIFIRNNSLIKQEKEEAIKKYSRVIYLDFLNALDEGFRVLKGRERTNVGKAPDLLPISKDFSHAVLSISDKLTSKEIILVNRLYGYIEKIRNDIFELNYQISHYDEIKFDYSIMEIEVFGDNYTEIITLPLENITIDYFLDKMKKEYLNLFKTLRNLGQI